MKLPYVIAWLVIIAFLAWSGNVLMRIQTYWAHANDMHFQQKELGALTTALQDLNRPGNDVLEHYLVATNRDMLKNYTQRYQSALEDVQEWARDDRAIGPLISDLESERSLLSGFASEILDLATQREALRTAGAEPDEIREKETAAAASMARMDQSFQNCLQILQTAKEFLVNRQHNIEQLQRRNFAELYLMLFVTLVASGLCVELIRRTMRQREALKASSDRINAIMGNVVDGIITVDADGIIESANPAANEMFGYRPNALVGLEFANLLDADCRQVYLNQVQPTAADDSSPLSLLDCEHPGYRKDGSCFPMELSITRMTVHGRYLLLHIVRDITARRRAENSLRQAASVFENINEGIMITDSDGNIQSVNPAFTRITGYSRDEVIGKNPRILHSNLHNRTFYRNMWTSLTETGMWQGEIWNRRRNGDNYPQWLTINAIRDERGRITNYLGVTWDITELKESERMKEEFFATVSHELRTPLTSVLGSLGMLIGGDGGPIPEKAGKLIHMAYSNSGRLVRLVNDIIDSEKMSAGRMKFVFTTEELMPIVMQTVESQIAPAREAGVTIEVVESLPGVFVNCDTERLMQALANLLSNAIRFSPPGDRVEIGVRRRGDTVRIEVTDHGIGVPQESRAKIFEKYTQLTDTDRRRQGGTGLGLNIAKLIIDKHNGCIDLESEPGRHTTFFIELPRVGASGGSRVAGWQAREH